MNAMKDVWINILGITYVKNVKLSPSDHNSNFLFLEYINNWFSCIGSVFISYINVNYQKKRFSLEEAFDVMVKFIFLYLLGYEIQVVKLIFFFVYRSFIVTHHPLNMS